MIYLEELEFPRTLDPVPCVSMLEPIGHYLYFVRMLPNSRLILDKRFLINPATDKLVEKLKMQESYKIEELVEIPRTTFFSDRYISLEIKKIVTCIIQTAYLYRYLTGNTSKLYKKISITVLRFEDPSMWVIHSSYFRFKINLDETKEAAPILHSLHLKKYDPIFSTLLTQIITR